MTVAVLRWHASAIVTRAHSYFRWSSTMGVARYRRRTMLRYQTFCRGLDTCLSLALPPGHSLQSAARPAFKTLDGQEQSSPHSTDRL